MPENIAFRPVVGVEPDRVNMQGVEHRSAPASVVSEVSARKSATVCAVQRLVKRFGGRSSPAILRGVSVEIADGEAVAVGVEHLNLFWLILLIKKMMHYLLITSN